MALGFVAVNRSEASECGVRGHVITNIIFYLCAALFANGSEQHLHSIKKRGLFSSEQRMGPT